MDLCYFYIQTNKKIKNQVKINSLKIPYKIKSHLNIIMSKFKIQLKKTDFKEGELVKTELGDKSIVLGMIKDRIYAMDSVCLFAPRWTTRGRMVRRLRFYMSLDQGVFDIRIAKASPKTNWVTDLNSYSVVVDEKNGEIFVEIY